ncbi:MAG: peroxiredoxin [Saprospiraceae bacterium]|nr:peroxiredoxin [Saprospiraceae bacterium]
MNEYLPKFVYEVGSPFPKQEMLNQKSKWVRFKDIHTDWIVLFFYPEDDSPTCTKQACNLRDDFKILKKLSITLFGVSPDSAKSHQKFIEKYKLPYDLLIDPESQLSMQLGIWCTKKFMGRVYEGMHRVTVILDRDLRIHHYIYPVKSGSHAEQIRSVLNL